MPARAMYGRELPRIGRVRTRIGDRPAAAAGSCRSSVIMNKVSWSSLISLN